MTGGKNAPGAPKADWQRLVAAGLAADLLPVVCDLAVPIHPKSEIKALGKIPSAIGGHGLAHGLKQWTSKVATAEEVQAWSGDDRLGICLQTRLCKVFDVDVEDEVLADRVENTLRPLIAEIADVQPDQVPLRFRGNSSKFAIIVKCEAVMSKRVINLGGTNKIEFLGNGQQAMIAGTHPSGSRIEWEASLTEAPSLTADHIDTVWRRLEHEFGSVSTGGAALGLNIEGCPPLGFSVGEIEEMIGYISPDVGREDWIRIGLALHHETQGDDTGLELWNDWSSPGLAYQGYEDVEGQWRSFKGTPPGRRPVTMATLIHIAKAGGYVNKKAQQAPARALTELLEVAEAICTADRGKISDLVTECAARGPIEQRAVLDAIKKSTGIPLGVLKKQLAQGQGSGLDHLNLARQVIELRGAANILCTDAQTWVWQGSGVWAVMDDRAVKQEVQSALARVPRLDVMSGTVNSVADVLKTEVFLQGHEFNCGSLEVVNCLNGQVELLDGGWKLRPHRLEDYRTTQIPVEFDGDARAPKFEEFLGQIFEGDADSVEKQQVLLELMGYTLMSHARHEKFAVLIGGGANGKSVLLSVLYELVGPKNVAGVQPSSFDNRFQRAHLHQKLANIVTELRQGEVIADAELKAITSGEPATVEHKHQDPFVMRPFATCWFGTNHMPHTRDFSEALFRRATILTFNRVFSEHERDPMLKDKLLIELPGILTLALNAYASALRVGFTSPKSSTDAKSEWRLEADQVAMFVDEVCETSPDAEMGVGELYRAYQNWASDSGISRIVSKRSMRERLSRLGFGSDRKKQGRLVTGLRPAEHLPMGGLAEGLVPKGARGCHR